jgi:hypothetical protein
VDSAEQYAQCWMRQGKIGSVLSNSDNHSLIKMILLQSNDIA